MEQWHTTLQNLAADYLDTGLWWGSDGEAQESQAMLLKISAMLLCKSDTVITANMNTYCRKLFATGLNQLRSKVWRLKHQGNDAFVSAHAIQWAWHCR